MFTCDQCQKPCGPKISPLLVVAEERTKEYAYKGFDEDGESTTMISTGTETVKEIQLCPTCSGVPTPTEVVPDLSVYVAVGKGLQAHGRRCKEIIDHCNICKRNLKTYNSLPVASLPGFLLEVHAPQRMTSLAALAVDSLIDRSTHNSKRAQADYAEAYRILKTYEQGGGGL